MNRKIHELFTAFVMSLAVWNFAWAEPIVELVVPTPPGGAVDMTARAISKALTTDGVENVVVYHPGANGDIALNKVLEKSNTSILIASSANFVFSHLVFDRENIHARDLQLIGPSLTNAMAFYAPLNKEIKTFKDLVARAREKELPCATSNSHGEIELNKINKQYNTHFVSVPYKGTGQLIPDVVGGHVPCAYDQIAPYTQLQDKLLFLATSGDRPYKPTIPTINTVLPGYQFVTWYAVGIPKNSTLLENKKFLAVVRNWTQQKELVDPLTERSFVLGISDLELNARAIKETTHYRNLLK